MKKLLALLLALVMVFSLVACAAKEEAPAEKEEAAAPAEKEEAPAEKEEAPAEEEAPDEEGLGEIAIVAMGMGMPYFEAIETGALAYAEANGYNVTFTGPASVDAAAQANVIQDLISKGVAAIAVSPVDDVSLASTLQEAADAGIRVITYDLDMADPATREFYVAPLDNVAMAKHMAEVMAELIGGAGQVAILAGTVTSTVENQRIEVMQEFYATEYPDIEVVAVAEGHDDMQQSLEAATNLMTAYPELAGIIGNSSVATPAAGQAATTAGKAGEVKVCGFATPNACKELVHAGAVQSVQLWDNIYFGEVVVQALVDLLSGKEIAEGYTFEQFPMAYVTATNEINIGETLDFTVDNIDDYNF